MFWVNVLYLEFKKRLSCESHVFFVRLDVFIVFLHVRNVVLICVKIK